MKAKKIIWNKRGQFKGGSSGVRYNVVVINKEIDYNKFAVFNLMCEVVEGCFHRKPKADIFIDRNFAINSKGLIKFCDASQNFEIKKLRRSILLLKR